MHALRKNEEDGDDDGGGGGLVSHPERRFESIYNSRSARIEIRVKRRIFE